MAKKPVTLSKGSKKSASYEDVDDDEDTSEDEFEEIEEETPTMSTKDAAPKDVEKPNDKALTPEEQDEKKIQERTAAKLKADEDEHQKVRDQLDKDNEQRKKEEEQAAAKAAKEEQAQQAKQDAEMRKGAHG